ncbi:hypothetical protein AKJ49_00870 [candidate division MSBL1 archaeon SCGC-AAA382A03]|uniref:Anion transporter n=1 Tax=candidate division MSBL1 archaeon SCGC-AAA382A03 TaxID=1698278 RepID=A0A133VG24_9EURY|nr:hypothetical protein AKJ49_00870 [candidate division MSBL1 archaeon SCGC-AAA382A03]
MQSYNHIIGFRAIIMGGNDEDELQSEITEEVPPLERPQNVRATIYLLIAFGVLFLISIIPTPMTPPAQRALGILVFVTILWVTEAFPLGMTALFGVTLLPVLEILPLSDAFFGFKNPALFFLIGALSFGIAIQKTNLSKRFSLTVLDKFGKTSSYMVFSICLIGCVMSWAMPSHAVAALLLPVLVSIIQAGKIEHNSKFAVAVFLALTYSTSVGSIGSLLGGARNILAIGILETVTETSIGFLDWMIAGVPIALVLTVLTFSTLKLVYPWKKIDTQKIRNKLQDEVKEIGPMSRGEKKASIIFFITLILWITVGRDYGLSVVAVGGFFALVVSRTINWRDIKQNMPWGLIFLYGGALTLSHALTTTNAVTFISESLVSFIGQNPLIVMITFLILVIIISNMMSNSAAVAVVLPIAIITITGLGAAKSYPGELVAYLIAMGSAMVFMLPVGTPSAAIVYSSGYVEVKDLVKAGSILTILSILVFLTIGLGWWKLIGIW